MHIRIGLIQVLPRGVPVGNEVEDKCAYGVDGYSDSGGDTNAEDKDYQA